MGAFVGTSRRFVAAAALVAVLAVVLGCHESPQVTQRAAAPRDGWQRVELYFGLSKPEGGTVSAAELAAFERRHIAPRLPGYTLLRAEGAYTGDAGQSIREPALLLICLYPADERMAYAAHIAAIVDAYKDAFAQESVLWVETRAGAVFR